MPYKTAPRIEGTIKRITSRTMPKHLVFFDTETYEIQSGENRKTLKFRLGAMIYIKIDNDCNILNRKVYKFTSEKEFIDKLVSLGYKYKNIHVFAHNVKFDIRVLYAVQRLEALGFSSEPPIINEMVFIWKLKEGRATINFLDTANFGIRSVYELGKDMGYAKWDIDFNTCSQKELMDYCLRDVEILEKFVYNYLSFISSNSLGAFKQTLASQSLTALRMRFLDEDIYIHNHIGATKLERDAYSGGRTEAFRLGIQDTQDYYYVDVNSMYPYAMTEFDLPARLCGYSEKINKDDFRSIFNRFYCIVDADISTNSNAYALKLANDKEHFLYLKNPQSLPYPKQSSRRLIFPTGNFRTILHHEELRLAIKEKSLVKIHRIAWYEKSRPFTSYVNWFYDAKKRYSQEGNKTWRLISKLFLNSLYGKFGQLQPHREEYYLNLNYNYGRFTTYDETHDVMGQIYVWNGNVYYEYKHGETSFSNAALAGAITSSARMMLYHFIKDAGKENVYYVDTDSLIVNKAGYDNLASYMDEDKVGYLGLEGESSWLKIYGCKDYEFGDKTVMKGTPKSAIKIAHNKWKYDKFEGFITWVNNNAKEGMILESRTKSRTSGYNKGLPQIDGSILPYLLKEF